MARDHGASVFPACDRDKHAAGPTQRERFEAVRIAIVRGRTRASPTVEDSTPRFEHVVR